jgi:hypothetical protein
MKSVHAHFFVADFRPGDFWPTTPPITTAKLSAYFLRRESASCESRRRMMISVTSAASTQMHAPNAEASFQVSRERPDAWNVIRESRIASLRVGFSVFRLKGDFLWCASSEKN